MVIPPTAGRRNTRRPLPKTQDFGNRRGLLSETGERKPAWYVLHDDYEARAADSMPR